MKELSGLEYAQLGADTIMRKFTPEELPPNDRFHYHQGIFLSGVEQIYKITKDKKYGEYIKAWVDFNIDENGEAPNCFLTEFDDIQPGILLFDLYKITKDERYKKVLDKMYDTVEKWPTNALGGVWHKYHNKNQMWLDTMYMFGVFAATYASEFDKPYMFEKIYKQAKLMRENMTDAKTGLMYHMWDNSKQHPRVNKENGLIERCWGRAMSWYVVALAEIIGLMPECEEKQDLINIEKSVLTALREYQDKDTGLWYQLVNKPDDSRNWHESSCTCLFTYGALKAWRLGIVDDSFKDMIINGYHGALSKAKIVDDELYVSDICIGTDVGDEEYYLTRPTSTNDLHGMGAFLLMCTEIEKSKILYEEDIL